MANNLDLGIQVGSPFSYLGALPLDARDQVEEKADLLTFDATMIDEGHITYCKEDETYYKWNGNSFEPLVFAGGSAATGGAGVQDWSADTDYKKNDLLTYDNKLYLVINDFTSGNTFVYDTAYMFLVSTRMSGTSIQFWSANENYKADDLIYFNNKIYKAKQGFQSGNSFDDINLDIVITNHNLNDGLQGDGGDFYHLTQDKHLLVNEITDVNGKLAYKGVVTGNMNTATYDRNNDGVVDKAETLLGLTVSVAELNALQGATANLQSQIDALSSGIVFQGELPTYADLLLVVDVFEGASYIIKNDETHGGQRTYYVYNTNDWYYMGVFDVSVRNFNTEPINLTTEVFNVLPAANIDNAIARKTELHTHNNYQLLETYTNSDASISDAIAKTHEHTNLFTLDNISEDGAGNLLFKGKPVQSAGGGSGISDLTNFTTDDLADYPNKRYVTDLEKVDIAKIKTIETGLNNAASTISSISGKLPNGVTTANPLITSDDLDLKINNLKIGDLSDVGALNPGEMLVVDKVSGEVVSKAIEDGGISSITDDKGTEIKAVKAVKFNKSKISQVQNSNNNEIEITPDDIFSVDLVDMPAETDFIENGFLVADLNSLSYKQRSLDEFTKKLENKSFEINSNDWIENNGEYEYQIAHGLGSENIIAAAYNQNASFDIKTEIINENNVKITSKIKEDLRIVINTTQGTISTTARSSNITQITQDMFIDDLRSRTDKTYSSDKINSLLTEYAKKSDVYTKIQADYLFAEKSSEHTHKNINVLNAFTLVNNELYHNGKKLITAFNPTTHTVSAQNVTAASLSLLVDTSAEMVNSGIKMISAAQILVKNETNTTNNPYLEEDYVRLIISEGNITIIDVMIEPGTSQQYTLGVSPNVKVSIKGNYSCSYVLAGF